MKATRLMKALMITFVVLAILNIALITAMIAYREQALATRSQWQDLTHTITQVQLGGEALTRFSRALVIMRRDVHFDDYNRELARDRLGDARERFGFYSDFVSEYDLALFDEIVETFNDLRGLEALGFEALREGDYDLAIDFVFGDGFVTLGRSMVSSINDLLDATDERLLAEITRLVNIAEMLERLMMLAIILFALVGLFGVWGISRGMLELTSEVNRVSHVALQGDRDAHIDVDKLDGIYANTANAINSMIAVIFKEREENERIIQVYESCATLITIWDRDANILDCNREALARFRLTSKDDLRHNFAKLSPEYQPDGMASAPQIKKLVDKAYDEGYIKFEWMHNTIDGELLPSEIYAYRITVGGEDLIVSFNNDLRPYMEEKYALARMRQMFDATPIIIEYWDAESNCVDTNAYTAQMLGYTAKEDYITRYHETMPEYQHDGMRSMHSWRSKLKEVFETGHAEWEFELRKLTGEQVFTRVRAWRVAGPDSQMVITYSADITELKLQIEKSVLEHRRMEVAEENSRAKSKFLATMSHEIRTPLASVLGISEIFLQKTDIPMEYEEAFSKIHSSAHTLLSIVNDVLDLSKIEAGKMTLAADAYDVASFIGDVLQVNLVHQGSRDVSFSVKVDENLPISLVGDELRIKQILYNLLSNAFKYTNQGVVRLSMEGLAADAGNICLQLSITDTGIGMSQEQLDVLNKFGEYTRFTADQAQSISGTGLGIHIVNSLISQMGGTINIASRPGHGTTVIVGIPQQIADAQPLGVETAHNLEQFQTGALYKATRQTFAADPMPYGSVLVVDDVNANLYVAKGLLSLYQLQIDTCVSGREAIDRIKYGNVYDVIFMDQMMPEMTGMQAVQKLREMGYTHPIVALTADALVGQAEKFLQNGFDGFLSKPIRTVQLNSVLTKFVKYKHMGRPEGE